MRFDPAPLGFLVGFLCTAFLAALFGYIALRRDLATEPQRRIAAVLALALGIAAISLVTGLGHP